MNLPLILKRITENLNEEQRCGLCWNFVFAGRQDYLNLAQAQADCNDECCVTLGVTKNSYKNIYQSNQNFTTKRGLEWSIEIFAGIPSRLDIQYFNEVDNCDEAIEQSKWQKYLYPIDCCLQGMDSLICNTHDCFENETTIEIWNWEAQSVINFLDNNYDGWQIKATFREWNI